MEDEKQKAPDCEAIGRLTYNLLINYYAKIFKSSFSSDFSTLSNSPL